jgi:hypothetical protein
MTDQSPEFLTPPAAPLVDTAPPTESASAPPPPPSETSVATLAEEPEPEKVPLVTIPVHYVVRIRELLDVIPATESAIVGQIRAMLPELV